MPKPGSSLPKTVFVSRQRLGRDPEVYLTVNETEEDATNEDKSPTIVGEYKLVATRKLRRKMVIEEL